MDENEIRQLAEASAQALQPAMPTGGTPSVQPRSTVAETPEEGEGPGILGTIGDMGKGVAEGAVKAVQETAQFGRDVINWFDDATGIDALDDHEYDFVPEWLETETSAGKMVSGVSQFLTGFAGAGKFLKATKLAGGIAKIGRGAKYINAAVQGAAADAVVFDPHEERFSNLITMFPALENPVTEYLAANPDDPDAEGRLKNVIEGLMLGGITDALFTGIKGIKARMFTKNADEFMETTAKAADAVDDALKNANAPKASPADTFPKAADDAAKGVDGASKKAKKGPKTQSDRMAEAGMTPTDRVAADEAEEAVKAKYRDIYKGDPEVSLEDYFNEVENIVENGRPQAETGRTPTSMINSATLSTEGAREHVEAIEAVLNKNGTRNPNTTTVQRQQDVIDKIHREADRWEDATYGQGRFFKTVNVTAEVAEKLPETTVLTKLYIDDSYEKMSSLMVHLANTEAGTEASKALEEKLRNIMKNSVYVVNRYERIKTGVGRGFNMMKNTKYGSLNFEEHIANVVEGIGKANRDEMMAVANRLLGTKGDPVKYAQMLRVNKKSGKFWALHNEYWMNSVLSGVTTMEVNAISNAIKAVVLMPLDKIAGGWGGFKGGFFNLHDKELFEEGIGTWRAMRGQIKDSLEMAAMSFRTGENILKGVSNSALDDDMVKNAWSASTFDLDPTKGLGKAVETFGNILNIPKKFLMSTDEFFAQLTYRAKTQLHLEKTAKRMVAEGKLANDPKAIADFVAERFKDAFVPKEFGNKSTVAQGIGVFKDALDEAAEATFSKELRYGSVSYRVSQMVNDHPWMRPVIPFIRTPVNIIRDLGQHTPFIAKRMTEYQEAIAKGGAEAAKAQGRVMVGGMLWSAGIMAAMTGNITGGGPKNEVSKKALLATGWRPYSIKVGDKYISYGRLDPFGMFLGLAADWAEMAPHLSAEDGEKAAMAMMMALPKNLTSKTYLKGLVDTLNAVTDPERNMAWVVKQRLTSYVPNFIAQTARTIDPEMKEAETLLDAFKAKFGAGPAQYSWLTGKPLLFHGGHASGLSPVVYSSGRNGMELLGEEFGKYPRAVSQPPKTYKGVELSPEQYSRACELHGTISIGGKTLEEALIDLFNSPQYDRKNERIAPDDDPVSGMRATMIRRVVTRYRERAYGLLMQEDAKLQEQVKQARQEKAMARIRQYVN